MKILIAADMEGVSGVVHWDDVTAGLPEYERFRRIMTGDVNAAIRAAIDAGAQDVLITDGHALGRNLLLEELDPRVHFNRGCAGPLSMVQGVETGVDGVMFVGYHARAGCPNSILSHTYTGDRILEVRLNGEEVGETGINAALCGHFGVPVVMISGDQAVCFEATMLLGEIESAAVKYAWSRMGAECLPLEEARRLIGQAAFRGVTRLREGQAPAPYRLETPITVSVMLRDPLMIEQALWVPGARQVDDRRIEYTGPDMVTVFQAFRSMTILSRV